jgi:phi LC3 family holin
MRKFFSKRRNKTFYMTALAQVLVVAQAVMAALGHGDILTELLQNRILAVADAVLMLLAMFGLVNDPTTSGLKDNERV